MTDPQAPPTQPLRVLIVDDDAMVGTLIELVAQSAGAATWLCQSPQVFFQAHRSWQPTHLVLDMRMPEMSGQQVLAELQRLQCRERIILTSGDLGEAQAAQQQFAAVLNIVGVLPKPFPPATLRALLR